MSEEQLKAFLEKVQSDTSLQEKLKAAADSDAVLAIAKEAGFVISADDWNKAQSELEDAELEAAAGGHGRCWDQSAGSNAPTCQQRGPAPAREGGSQYYCRGRQ